jgi:glycosyltransferase involved in cell wall biosynthesis
MPVILQLVHDFYDNSMSRLVIQIMQQLIPQGYTFHVGAVTDYDKISDEFRATGATLVEFFKAEKMQEAIRDYVRQNDIHLVHSHSPRTAIVGGLAIRRLAGIAHVHTRHLLTQPSSRRFGLVYTAVDRASLFMPDVIIPVSKTMGEQIKQVPLLPAEKVQPIQNGVNTTRFHVPYERAMARAELGLSDAHTAFIYTGRLDVMKRIDLLIQAFARVHADYPDSRLVIVGRGDLEAELKTQAAGLGLDEAVIWTGFRTDIPYLLAAGDIYVQSSSNEGLSLSILEAMAAEKTIISTDVGAAREMLEQDVTGIIIPPLDVNALTAAMRRVLEKPQTAQALAARARKVVVGQFSIEGMAEQYRQVYERYLK